MNFLRREESVSETQLQSEDQLKVASLVKSLKDDELSLAWRSELNAKLMAAQQTKAKKKSAFRVYAWGSSLSVGVAAAVFAGTILLTPKSNKVAPQTNNSSLIASELVQAHEESMVFASVSGTGSAARETMYVDDSYGMQDDLL